MGLSVVSVANLPTSSSVKEKTRMRQLEVELLRCPNCAGRIDDSLCCIGCKTQFACESGVYNLLPGYLEDVKKNENLVFEGELDEVMRVQARPWRSIINRPEVLRFDNEIVDLYRGGRFLELGGETCFASAIYKSVYPDATVYASDVSPNSLRNGAIPTCGLFPEQPDFYIALDAENIPFRDRAFQSVFALTMIHHLPNPVKMLNEVQRVLTSGGRFIAIDASVPNHFVWLFAKTAHERVDRYGIQEDLISYSRWMSILSQSAIPVQSLKVYTKGVYQQNPMYSMAGRIVNKIPSVLARQFFPVGVMIVYDKP
jgi:SAM-dependent methyltransferase